MNTDYVICTGCMRGGMERESARYGDTGMKLTEYTCPDCGATGREWSTPMGGRRTADDLGRDDVVRRVDLSREKWAEARGTWPTADA